MTSISSEKSTPKPNYGDLLDAKQLLPLMPFSRPSLYIWSRTGKFPKPVSIGDRLRWHRADVNQWLSERGLAPLPAHID